MVLLVTYLNMFKCNICQYRADVKKKVNEFKKTVQKQKTRLGVRGSSGPIGEQNCWFEQEFSGRSGRFTVAGPSDLPDRNREKQERPQQQ